jgi:hypothetical protein
MMPPTDRLTGGLQLASQVVGIVSGVSSINVGGGMNIFNQKLPGY